MKIEKYKVKQLQSGKVTWVLASCKLFDYLNELKSDFFDFDIQRRIVKNTYLDKIWETISYDEPLPAFSLTTPDSVSGDSLDMWKTEVIDGLQRTYRLWSIYFFNVFISEQFKTLPSFDELYSRLKSVPEGERLIESKILSRSIVRKLIDNNYEQLSQLIEKYKTYDIVVNIWSGLNDREIVNKMLTLNAGQRQVNSTHQYELMFLHYFRNINWPKGINIIREKYSRFNEVKSGNRKKGDFLMSSIVVAMQSYIQGRPLRINQVNNLRIDDDMVEQDSSEYFSSNQIINFVKLIQLLEGNFDINPKVQSWIMKDTTQSGLFAALGKVTHTPKDFSDSILHKTINKITSDNVKWNEFESSYKDLSSVSTNVGNAVRKACFRYFQNLFIGQPYSWHRAFTDKDEKK